MPPPIDQQVTFLYTTDLAAMAAFYADVLQLPLALDQGGCRIYRSGRDSFLGICRRDAPVDPDGVIVTLVSDDVDGWYAYLQTQLASAAFQIEKPPTFNPHYNIYHLFLRDPAGYLIEIQTFRDPAWPRG